MVGILLTVLARAVGWVDDMLLHSLRRDVPRSYSPEFHRKALDLLKAGRRVADLARDLQVGGQTIYVWRRQASQDAISAGRTANSSSQGRQAAASMRWRRTRRTYAASSSGIAPFGSGSSSASSTGGTSNHLWPRKHPVRTPGEGRAASSGQREACY
jgi:transposase-like protein